MSTAPDTEYQGEGRTIEEAAEDAAKKVPKEIQNETYKLTISARLSGEHNPIHGYIVDLGGGG
jgi:hypothetical protein